jgi:hypothetical protein
VHPSDAIQGMGIFFTIYTQMTRKLHLQCGAKTRRGTLCQCMKLPGKTRCKFHGGASTGPRTAEGKRQSTKNLYKARKVLARKSHEWFRERSLKAGATRRRRDLL